MHADWWSSSSYFPAWHGSQVDDPLFAANVPRSHGKQSRCPVSFMKYPLLQRLHSLCPTSLSYFPTGQASHTDDPHAKCPFPQSCLPFANVPSRQLGQVWSRPVVPMAVPAAHSVHTLRPDAEPYDPTAQASQTVEPQDNAPFGHGDLPVA